MYNKKDLAIIYNLSKYSFIPKRKIRLFFIGIILITLIGTIMGGYVEGIQQKDFFIANNSNTMVISDKTATTPITGIVPMYFVDALDKINGITIVSPEVYGLGVLSGVEAPIYVHGITPSFFDLNPVKMISGFNPLEKNSTNLYSIIIGKNIFENLNLQLNSSITLSSVLKESIITFKIAGVFESGTAADDQILAPLDLARALSLVQDYFVTLIQLKFNPTIISKDKINNIVSSNIEYNLELIPKTNFLNYLLNDIAKFNVVITRSDGTVIDDFTPTNKILSFNLTFGLYQISIQNSLYSYTDQYSIVAINNLNNTFSLKVGPDIAELNVTVIKDGVNIKNLNISANLAYENGNFLNIKEENPYYNIFYLEKFKYYRIIVTVNNQTRYSIIYLNSNNNLSIDLDKGIIIQLFDPSDITHIHTTIQDVNFTVVNKLNQSVPFIQVNDQSQYQILFNETDVIIYMQKGNITRKEFVHINLANPPATIQRFFGIFQLNLTNINPAIAIKTWNIFDSNNKLIKTIQNSQTASFEAMAGSDYIVEGIHDNMVDRFKIAAEPDSTYNIMFKTNYQITLKVYNATDSNNPLIDNFSWNITKENSTINQIVNNGGFLKINVTNMDFLNINITVEGKTFTTFIDSFSDYNSIILLPVKDLRVIIKVSTLNGFPIENKSVTVYSYENNEYFNYTSDNHGIIDVIIPLSNISILYKTNLVENQQYFEVTKPGIVNFTIIIDIKGNLNVTVVDINNIPISNAKVELIPLLELNTNQMILQFTDNSGAVNFNNISWGYFKITVIFQKITKSIDTTIDANNTSNLIQLQFDLIKLQNSANQINLKTFRDFKITDSSAYINSFLKNSLTVFIIVLTIAVLLTVVFSALSLDSIISFPIYQHKTEITYLKLIGIEDDTIAIIIALKLAVYSIVASLVGIMVSILILNYFSGISTTNIAGFVFTPNIDIGIVIGLITTIFIITLSIAFYNVKKQLKSMK